MMMMMSKLVNIVMKFSLCLTVWKFLYLAVRLFAHWKWSKSTQFHRQHCCVWFPNTKRWIRVKFNLPDMSLSLLMIASMGCATAISRHIKCTSIKRPCILNRKSDSPSHCRKKLRHQKEMNYSNAIFNFVTQLLMK